MISILTRLIPGKLILPFVIRSACGQRVPLVNSGELRTRCATKSSNKTRMIKCRR